MNHKKTAPRKIPRELLRAQHKLDSACLQNKPKSVIAALRAERDRLRLKWGVQE